MYFENSCKKNLLVGYVSIILVQFGGLDKSFKF